MSLRLKTIEGLTTLLSIIFIATAGAAEIHVPDDHKTIQAAIDAAKDGDEILVAPGVYAEAIDYLGKSITIASTAGPMVTTIDATGLNMSVVTIEDPDFDDNEHPNITLTGFRITGGNTGSGGGIVITNSHATITTCNITANEAVFGGGLRLNGGSGNENLLIENCLFEFNVAVEKDPVDGSCGGAINAWGGNSILIIDTVFNNNLSYDTAGGLCFEDVAETELRGCFIDGNAAENGGGGIEIIASNDITFENCNFSQNEVTGFLSAGGGVAIRNSEPSFIQCLFESNYASELGGAVYNENITSSTFTDCVFIDNLSSKGGAVFNLSSMPTFNQCKFGNNKAGERDDEGVITVNGDGGAMYNDFSAMPTLINCLMNFNDARIGGAMFNIKASSPVLHNCTIDSNNGIFGGTGGFVNFDSNPILQNCILYNNGSSIFDFGTSATTADYCNLEAELEGTANIDMAPVYVDPNGADNISGNGDDDYTLAAGSPGLDSGNNASVPGGVVIDIWGRTRFVNDAAADCPQAIGTCGVAPIVDMGAFERQAIPCPADQNGDGIVNVADLLILFAQWGTNGSADLDGNGIVNTIDLLLLFANWGPCL